MVMKIQTTFLAVVLSVPLFAQQELGDPFVEKQQPRTSVPTIPGAISLCYEAFSMPLEKAAALQRMNPTDEELYLKIIASVGTDSFSQETFAILRGRSGEIAKSQNIAETIYPVEFQPGTVPTSLSVSSSATDGKGGGNAFPPAGSPFGLRIPATPSAFETRNVGFTLEAEGTLSEDERIIDLRIVPEYVALVGYTESGQEFSQTTMPEFESQRLTTAVSMEVGKPFLLGTMNRPPGSKQDADSAKRVWFAFITPTLSKN